jgi:hypothetical protein
MSIIQQRRVVEREVPDHFAAPFKKPFGISKSSASEEKESHPARVEDEPQGRVGRSFGRRKPDYETRVPVAH